MTTHYQVPGVSFSCIFFFLLLYICCTILFCLNDHHSAQCWIMAIICCLCKKPQPISGVQYFLCVWSLIPPKYSHGSEKIKSINGRNIQKLWMTAFFTIIFIPKWNNQKDTFQNHQIIWVSWCFLKHSVIPLFHQGRVLFDRSKMYLSLASGWSDWYGINSSHSRNCRCFKQKGRHINHEL